MIEVDVETTGIQWTHCEMFLGQFYDGETLDVLHHPKDKEKIQAWLNKDDLFRAWNAKFDFHVLERAGYKIPSWNRIHDGIILAHLMDNNTKRGLKERAMHLFGDTEGDTQKEVKEWLRKERIRRKKELGVKELDHTQDPTYKDIPLELMQPYAEYDVILTKKICDYYMEDFKKDTSLHEIYKIEQQVSGALFAIENRGLPIDTDAAKRLSLALEEELDQLWHTCLELANNDTININSNHQLYEVLKARGVTEFTFKEGKDPASDVPTLDEAALLKIDDEFVRTLLKYKKVKKQLGTYVKPLLEHSKSKTINSWKYPFIQSGRVHPNFNQLGADTGRMSSNDPNCQNWPARGDLRLRYLLRAEEGKVLIACDLDAIEMALFGYFIGKGVVLESIRDGLDIHQITANLLGLNDRFAGKLWNFSILYGAGAPRLSTVAGWSIEKTKQARTKYFTAFPEVKDFIDNVKHEIKHRGYIETPWGRRFLLGSDKKDYIYGNYKVQGTAADLFKASVVRMHQMEIPIISLIHDEVLAEVDEELAEEIAEKMRHCLTDHPRISKVVPLSADATIVKRWSEVKDPNYIPSYMGNENGLQFART